MLKVSKLSVHKPNYFRFKLAIRTCIWISEFFKFMYKRNLVAKVLEVVYKIVK